MATSTGMAWSPSKTTASSISRSTRRDRRCDRVVDWARRKELPMSYKRINRRALHRAEALEARRLLSTVVWDGGGDGENWNDPANWVGDNLPADGDDVVISVPASN